MAKKNMSPIMTWIIWSILVFGGPLAVTWEYFIAGFTADASKITWLILVFFIWGFASSLFVAFYLESESKSIRDMDADQAVGDPNSSDAAALFDSAMERIRKGERIDTRNLITAYSGKLKAKVDNIGVVAGMLITMGLLGTVVGLVITVSGLDQVLQSNSADFASMKDGLTQTVSGMGTAFYTTIFGALLGGVVLKVLGAEMRKTASILVADTLRFSELYVAPQFQAKASESLIEFENRIAMLHGQLSDLGGSIGEVIDTIMTKEKALESGLESMLSVVTATNEKAVERTNELVSSIGTSMQAANEQANERLASLTASVEAANEQSNARVNALVSAINETIAVTNRLADERTEALRTSTTEATEKAEERLNTAFERIGQMLETSQNAATTRVESLVSNMTTTTEEANRLADERLKALVRTIDHASESVHEQADAQLSSLVKNVESAIQSTRKDAEDRLNSKASDLAGKLTEAAGMLSGLVNSTQQESGSSEGE